MPVYLYEVIKKNGKPGERFEVTQSMKDDALTEHPETGEPVRRVITAANIGGSWSDQSMHRNANDEKKLERLGFTKYEKTSDGYVKKFGKGPQIKMKND